MNLQQLIQEWIYEWGREWDVSRRYYIRVRGNWIERHLQPSDVAWDGKADIAAWSPIILINDDHVIMGCNVCCNNRVDAADPQFFKRLKTHIVECNPHRW